MRLVFVFCISLSKAIQWADGADSGPSQNASDFSAAAHRLAHSAPLNSLPPNNSFKPGPLRHVSNQVQRPASRAPQKQPMAQISAASPISTPTRAGIFSFSSTVMATGRGSW